METYLHSPVNAPLSRARSLVRGDTMRTGPGDLLMSGNSFSASSNFALGLLEKSGSMRMVNALNDTDLQAAAAAAVEEAANVDHETMESLVHQIELLRKERDEALDTLMIESSRWVALSVSLSVSVRLSFRQSDREQQV